MKKQNIKIGYEWGVGSEVKIPLAHTVITGLTQESGKTTCITALVKRSGLKALIIKTKIGEKAISEGTIIPPFYKEDFDWEYASELLESSRKEKLKFERSWIIKYSKNATNLLEFKRNIDNALAGKLRELERSVLITLQAYLEKILPELQYAPLSKTLDLKDGINIMDLERFKEETQTLIIRSVLNEVLNKEKNCIIVCPECWKYLPEKYASPVKRPAEAFIRQGATNNNYLWLDSQDVTGISKVILKQVSNWCLTPDTLIRTKEGYKEIAQIKKGDFVLTHKGEFKRVKKVMKRKYAGKLYKIKCYGNPKELKITPEHPILCESIHKHGIKGKATQTRQLASGITKTYHYERMKKLNPKWIKASEINRNNLFMLSIPKETNQIIYPLPFPLNKDLMNLIGWYLAEGFLEKNIVTFTLGGTEINEARGILDSAKILGINGDFKKYDYRSVIRIRLFSQKLNKFLFDNFNKGASNKKIPSWIFTVDKKIIKILLESYTKGDGHQLKSNLNRFKLSSVSQNLIYGIRDICLYLGYPASVCVGRKEGKEFLMGRNKLSNLKTKYVLHYDTSIERFGNRQAVGRVGIDENYGYFRVRNIVIEEEYSGFVCNIEVEKDNSYTTDICSVHNCLGYQREINEIERTLDQIPMSKKDKPKAEDIATLKLGQFYVATSEFTKKVYAQPTWVDDKTAIKVAKGKIDVSDLEQPTHIAPYQILPTKSIDIPQIQLTPTGISIDYNKKLNELRDDFISNRNDFFTKFEQINETVSKIYSEIFNMKQSAPKINEDEIVMRVLQKMPVPKSEMSGIGMANNFNKEEIIMEVLKRVPVGAITYTVAPLEKLQKDFLEEAKNKILSDVSNLSNDAKKTLKYLESRGVGCKTSEIVTKGFFLTSGGGNQDRINKSVKELSSVEVARKDTGGANYGRLKDRIKELLSVHNATEQEIEQVHNHVLMEMLGE